MKALNFAVTAVLTLASSVSAATINYAVALTGAESGSTASGTGLITIDTTAQTMEVAMQFSGLFGSTTASHIHCCTAVPNFGTIGVATQTPRFIGFPTGVTSGSYDQIFDLTLASTYNPAFVTAWGGVSNAEAELLAGMASGKAYLNVHSTFRPAGEISGFLVEQTPEPATFALLGAALAGFALVRRKRNPQLP